MKKRHIIIIGGVLIFAFVVGIVGSLPTPVITKSNNLRIYDRSNNLIYEEVYGVKSKYIELEKLPSYVPASFIAIEDKNFYSHKGFDFKRIIKSFFINLTSFKIKEGASPISQQYARNTMLSNERTLLRKIKEAYYTFKIESKYSKQEILEGYLNSLYFGHGITGIEGASNFYFNKSAEHLTLSEATVLAAVCNAPAVYSPSINPKNTKVRQNKVLRKMYDLDFISEKQYYDAVLDSNEYYLEKDNPDNFYYYRDAVIQELVSLNLYENKAKLKGLKVITNINIDLNSKINEIIGKHKPTDEDIQVSVVVMEPFSNKVLSLNGGFDYNLSSFNRALSSKRSVASTIKPLLYYLALINNFNPTTKLTSEKTNFYIKDFGSYSPSNPS
ncbi:TPA: penicillin-binding protein, partial [bacterium]|nr:penicillin-binding protein [bacterium]